MRRREFIRLLGGSAQRDRLERLAAGTDPACHRSCRNSSRHRALAAEGWCSELGEESGKWRAK
jgi:hypothetical protein